MVQKKNIIQNLPGDIGQLISTLSHAEFDRLEEVRLRLGKPVTLTICGAHKRTPLITTKQHIDICMQKISKASIYAYIDEIKNGFITIDGGHRVGLCGRVVMQGSEVHNIKNISGINFRIAREILCCADPIMPMIRSDAVNNTIIISPPGCGKTTMLRDAARQIGKDYRVSIIDERGEIAAMRDGVPQFDVGDMTDVIDLSPKNTGIFLMLRSMSPEVIVTDEITQSDIPSIKQALSCGVKIIATAHGDDVRETLRRLEISDVLDYFGSIILLGRENGQIVIKNTYDGRDFIDGKNNRQCDSSYGVG